MGRRLPRRDARLDGDRPRAPTRDAVDALHADLTAAGHPSRQRPYDAFWGARYAIVEDPDGNPVGLMSPSDDARRHWPPEPPPR
ncbi:MAG: VOC family protein [Solirubrobacteraceae bacterium]